MSRLLLAVIGAGLVAWCGIGLVCWRWLTEDDTTTDEPDEDRIVPMAAWNGTPVRWPYRGEVS